MKNGFFLTKVTTNTGDLYLAQPGGAVYIRLSHSRRQGVSALAWPAVRPAGPPPPRCSPLQVAYSGRNRLEAVTAQVQLGQGQDVTYGVREGAQAIVGEV